MNTFKKDLACNIALIVALVFSVVHLLVLTLGLFGTITLELYDEFNYIFAFILVVLSLALYILSFFITKIKGLVIPVWFRISFYIAFFLFTNTYYIVGGYRNIISIILFFIYLSYLTTMVNLSVFYNTQKDEKYRLKTSKNYIVTSVFFYSVGTNAIIELIITAIKSFAFPEFKFSTLNTFIVEMSVMILTTIVMCAIFYLSLSKTKKLINSCLIKTGVNLKSEKN